MGRKQSRSNREDAPLGCLAWFLAAIDTYLFLQADLERLTPKVIGLELEVYLAAMLLNFLVLMAAGIVYGLWRGRLTILSVLYTAVKGTALLGLIVPLVNIGLTLFEQRP